MSLFEFLGLNHNLQKTRFRELVEIENSLGQFQAAIRHPEDRAVAGRLYDAIVNGDERAVSRIAARYQDVVRRLDRGVGLAGDTNIKYTIGKCAQEAHDEILRWKAKQSRAGKGAANRSGTVTVATGVS